MAGIGVGVGVGGVTEHGPRPDPTAYGLDDDGLGGWVWTQDGQYGLVDASPDWSWATSPTYAYKPAHGLWLAL